MFFPGKTQKTITAMDLHRFSIPSACAAAGQSAPSGTAPETPAILEEYERRVARMTAMSPSFQHVGRAGYHPGLATMTAFLDFLGNPHRRFRSVHVAGTNGKGSVSHMLASVLAAHGYRTGLYTSPHLADFRERVRIGKEPVPKAAVVDFFRRCESFMEAHHPSFFEITTALAFDYFAREQVDIAVIETGLGGRLDSTNLIEPLLSVITSIGYDHCDLLGHTLPEIAAEKAGIIKPGISAVVGPVDVSCRPVFRERAASCGASLYFAEDEAGGIPDPLWPDPSEMDLSGEYQRLNLLTVRTALRVLGTEGKLPGFVPDPVRIRPALCEAAARTGLRGRWDRLRSRPDVYGDIAHNESGLRLVFKQLSDTFRRGQEEGRYGRLVLIVGMVSDKDIDRVRPLFPRGDYIFTAAPGPRAMPPAQLAEALRGSADRFRVTGTVEEALALYESEALPTDLVYVGGSSYVVAEALKYRWQGLEAGE